MKKTEDHPDLSLTPQEEQGRGSPSMPGEAIPAREGRARILWLLFWEFFKIAALVVGGGFAILLVAEDVFARRRKWLREGELTEMLPLIQTVPGLTAGNLAIYIGHRLGGFWGSFAALVGVALPSFLVITLVAMGFTQIPVENRWIQGAFLGVRTACGALTFVTLTRLWKSCLGGPFQAILFILAVCGVIFLHLNPGYLILGGLLAGLAWSFAGGRRV